VRAGQELRQRSAASIEWPQENDALLDVDKSSSRQPAPPPTSLTPPSAPGCRS